MSHGIAAFLAQNIYYSIEPAYERRMYVYIYSRNIICRIFVTKTTEEFNSLL